MTRAQLRAAGLPASAIDHRLAIGRLVPLLRGVYAVGHGAVTPRGWMRAALLAVGPDAVLSHRSAAALWRLCEPPDHVHVGVPGRKLRPRPRITPHHVLPYPAEDVRLRDGLRLTSPLRTLVDLAAADDPGLERAVSEAQVLRLVRRRDLTAATAQRRRGGARLARLVDHDRAMPTRSKLERAMLRIVLGADLPRPQVNARVERIEVDFAWPAQRVVVEVDGWHAHGHRSAFERDRARDAELHARGWAVLRFTWRQLTGRPLLVAARLARVLEARRTAAPG